MADRLATFYEHVAPAYGFWAALMESRAHRHALAAVREHAHRDLLNVAAGTGTECAALSADPGAGRCVGVDLSMGMLKRARRRTEAGHGSQVLWCRADARKLPFRSACFDALLNCYMLDLLPESDIPGVIGEFGRVLHPAGRLVLVIMGRQTPIVQRLWMAFFRHLPLLVGGCRTIDAARWLTDSGWAIEKQERISQKGFRSELLVARPPAAAGR